MFLPFHLHCLKDSKEAHYLLPCIWALVPSLVPLTNTGFSFGSSSLGSLMWSGRREMPTAV